VTLSPASATSTPTPVANGLVYNYVDTGDLAGTQDTEDITTS
jgi:hypothetical protein